MPIFLDRHDLPGMSAEDNRRGASAGSRRAGALWRRFLTYWFDSMQGTAFCLVEAPDAETANRVHEEAHGGCVDHVIEIDKAAVYAFLGRVADPVAPGGAAARPQDFDSAYRAMMFTDIVGSGAILVSRELCDGPRG